ncbi:Variant-specific surface protein [Giardia duodenalis]|uniref:Variant-specific surface protein n=1 Tax=Giardia intestinalis TaxID=5741 RepID=V6TSD1_GIAIN|nr:Variant-specific surface protein [Giardia intestinalis]
MSVCRVGGRTRTPVTACARLHLEAHRRDSGGLAAVVHPSNDMDLHPPLGECYNVSTAGSGVCREARDGACVMYKEEVRAETKEQVKMREGSTGCTANGDNNCQTCDVTINGKTYCSQCKANYVPIDGTCVDESGQDAKCTTTTKGACTQCGNGYFLHRGGCYLQTATPGSTICTNQTTAGVCGTCNTDNGYFRNPEAAATADSCISCGDVTGVAVSDKTYKGVADCAKCNGAELQSGASGIAKCTECVTDLYLKTEASDTSCISAKDCNTGYFPTTDTTDSKKKCLACNTADKGGIDGCSACELLPSTTRASTVLISCSACSKNNLSPLKNECMQNCPAGTYETGSINKVCTPCHTSCASCESNANQDSCTACYPGYVLSKTDSLNTGTCIPECTGRYAENCEANQCTAVLGGSKYCSKCKSGYVPVDGLCVLATTRAPTGCTPGEGVCSSCTRTYFLQSGGCYNTQALPGMAVCTAASNGQCTTCANGQQYTNNNCPACAEGRAKCQSSTSTCTACLAGYYKTFTDKCVNCSKNSTNGGTNIQGIKDCMNCILSSDDQGPVTCCPKIDSCTIDTRGDGVDKNIFSTSVVTCVSSLGTLTIGGLAGFFVNDRPVAIAGGDLLEETDLSTVYESASLCNAPT